MLLSFRAFLRSVRRPAGRRKIQSPRPVQAVEVLQQRTLLTAIKLADIDTTGFGAEIRDFVELNGTGYFLAGAVSDSGQNLWTTDGTPAGTEPVTSFPFGTLDHLTRVNDTLFFGVDHGNNQVTDGLWKSDGTADGTQLVREFFVVDELINNDGTLYFAGHDHRGVQVWKSDGTFEGTTQVFEPGPRYGGFAHPQVFQQRVVYVAGSYSAQLDDRAQGVWISDGTEGGTQLLKQSGQRLGQITTLATTPNGIFAEIPAEGGNDELWFTHGSSRGTTLLSDSIGIGARDFSWFNGRTYFRREVAGQNGIWSTDGTFDGTTRILPDLRIGSLLATDYGLYFTADDESGSGGSVGGGTNGDDELKDWQVYRTDGTVDGTVRITSLQSDEDINLLVQPLRTDGTRVYVTVTTSNTGSDRDLDIYRIHPNEDGSHRIDRLNTDASSPTEDPTLPAFIPDPVFETFDGRFLYVDDDANDQVDLWSADTIVPVSPIDNPLRFLHPRGRGREQHPEFSWTAVHNAVSYEIWVGLNGSSEPVLNETVSSTKFATDSPFEPGRYTAWVRARLNDGMVTDWMPQTFQISKSPRVHHLQSPTSEARPTISWDAIPGATEYRVFVSNTTKRSTVVDEVVTSTSFTPTADFEMGRHRIWVAALANGFQGNWSHVQTLDITPTAVMTREASLELRPTFSWNAVPGVSEYQIYISAAGGFVINESEIADTSFTPSEDLQTGVYRWWVRGKNSDDRYGPWSDLNKLYTGGLTQAEVTTHFSDNTPTLTWPEVPGAISYEVYISGGGRFDPTVYRQAGLTDTTFNTPPIVDSAHDWVYRVWIRTTLSDGSLQWGPGMDFEILDFPDSIFRSFAFGTPLTTFDGSPTFRWNVDNAEDTYEIFLHTPQQQIHFTDIPGGPISEVREWTPPTPLRAWPGDWKWWLRAVNKLGRAYWWGPGDDFHAAGRPRAIQPNPAVTTDPTPFFWWTQTEDATDYEIFIRNLGTGADFVNERTGPTTGYIPPDSDPLPPGMYRYWVRAINGTVTSPWSVGYDFEVQA